MPERDWVCPQCGHRVPSEQFDYAVTNFDCPGCGSTQLSEFKKEKLDAKKTNED